jgi:tRNA 2-selenouridine synthase
VLDLEALACHRGSVLGGLPDKPQPPQKRFDTLLWQALRALDPARPVFVESESKKVGNVAVPEALIQAMRASPCVRLELSEDERVALLLEDYAFLLHDTQFLCGRLDALHAVRGRVAVQAWKEMVQAGRFDELVRGLLRDHYDPGYLQSIRRSFSQYEHAETIEARDRSSVAMLELARRLLTGAAA